MEEHNSIQGFNFFKMARIFALAVGISFAVAACGGGDGGSGGCDGVVITACNFSGGIENCPDCPGDDGYCVAIDGDASNDRCCGCGDPF